MIISLFTDGSIIGGNPGGIMGWSVVAMPSKEVVGHGRLLAANDNSSARAELLGILAALTYISDQLTDNHNLVVGNFEIHSDSQYAIGMLEKGWKVKANRDLVASLRSAHASLGSPKLVWVKGHADSWGNKLADKAARAAAEGTLEALENV